MSVVFRFITGVIFLQGLHLSFLKLVLHNLTLVHNDMWGHHSKSLTEEGWKGGKIHRHSKGTCISAHNNNIIILHTGLRIRVLSQF
jgi:hypothetical protein